MFGRRRIEYKTNAQLRAMQRAGEVTSRALDAAVAAAVVPLRAQIDILTTERDNARAKVAAAKAALA